MDGNDRIAVSRLALQQGQKYNRAGVGVIRAVVGEVVDDADDLALNLIDDNGAAESISPGPIAIRHILVDHGDFGRGVVIGSGEIAALLDLNTSGAEEVGSIEV